MNGHPSADESTIRFKTAVADSDYDKVAAIDHAGIYVIDRKSRAPMIGYSYFLRMVPLSAIDYVDIVRESRGQRVRRGLFRFVLGLALCALLIVMYQAGRIMIELAILAPLGVLLAIPHCFQGLSTTLTFMVSGRKHALELTSQRWRADGLQIVQNLAAADIQCRFHGFPPQPSASDE